MLRVPTKFEEEKDMAQKNGSVKRSEKGLLTPDNCVLYFSSIRNGGTRRVYVASRR